MNVLVTGADGFIGSHLTEALVAAGHRVRAMVYYNSFGSWGWLDHSPVKDDVEIFVGDVRDGVCVRQAVADCSVVYHLAALIGIPYSYYAPASYVDTNMTGTLNVLQAARERGGVKVVHTSTSEVYGSAQFVPITEEHPLHAQSPYAASKIGADQMAMSYHYSFELPVAIARPFNTYGPRQSARAVIPTIISQIAKGKREIELGATTPTRDFNFVDDTVRGLMAIGGSEHANGQVINLGSGFEISIGDAAALIADLMGADVIFRSKNERLRPAQSEVTRLWAENAKAQRLIQWSPAYGGPEGFKRGLERTIAWFTEPANLAGYKTQLYAI